MILPDRDAPPTRGGPGTPGKGLIISLLEIYFFPGVPDSAWKGGVRMPTYSFRCEKCGKVFREILSFREYEEGKRKCPKCGSRSIAQLLEPFFAKTSRKS
jgi:putative FmdB family regulatory protein